MLTFGIAVAVIGFLPPLPVILSFAVVVGLVYGPIQPIYNYVMQTRAPHHLRGRVVGVMTGLTFAAGPLGLLVLMAESEHAMAAWIDTIRRAIAAALGKQIVRAC